jgi:hypothetical protein
MTLNFWIDHIPWLGGVALWLGVIAENICLSRKRNQRYDREEAERKLVAAVTAAREEAWDDGWEEGWHAARRAAQASA